MANLNLSSKEALEEINETLNALAHFQEMADDQNDVLDSFDLWRDDVKNRLHLLFTNQSIKENFLIETKVIPNRFSEIHTKREMDSAFRKGKRFLENLVIEIEQGRYSSIAIQATIDIETAIEIIRRLLNNFYKHIETMYQAEVHGNSKFRKEDLDKIKIGNEYDVQRVLYSLIKPIFPTARLEKADDGGYRSVRYDIVLDDYNIVIEVKCTRDSMSERNLTEELGSDSFHYKADHLFLFIYDKVKLIKNPDAFSQSFIRNIHDFDKTVETIIIQGIVL